MSYDILGTDFEAVIRELQNIFEKRSQEMPSGSNRLRHGIGQEHKQAWFNRIMDKRRKLYCRRKDKNHAVKNAIKDFREKRGNVRPAFAEDVYGSRTTQQPQSTISVTDYSESGPNTTSACGNRSNLGYSSNESGSDDMCVSALAQRRSAQLPKLKELSGPCGNTSLGSMDHGFGGGQSANMAEIDFKYSDCDKHSAEMSELYTYSEAEDFILNFEAFSRYVDEKKMDSNWCKLDSKDRKLVLHDLAQRLESADSEVRLTAARILLYIFQGAYGDFKEDESDESPICEEENSPQPGRSRTSSTIAECEFSIGGKISPIYLEGIGQDKGTGGHDEQCLINGAAHAYAIYEAGFFQPLCTMLLLESQEPFDMSCCAERSHSRQSSVSNSRSASNVDLADSFERRNRKSATLADNESLRVVINCLYHMLESIRRHDMAEKIVSRENKYNIYGYTMERLKELRDNFITELDEPLESAKTPLVIMLFDMMPAFVRGTSRHYPIKKILLLCWKILLATLGDMKFLREEKARKRAEAGLPPVEDTITVASKLKSTNCDRPAFDSENVMGRMGRKVRSLHPARPFNRQIALGSSSAGSNFWQNDRKREGGSSGEDDMPDSNSDTIEEGDDDVMLDDPKMDEAEKIDELFENKETVEGGGMNVPDLDEKQSAFRRNLSFNRRSRINERRMRMREGPSTPKAEAEAFPIFSHDNTSNEGSSINKESSKNIDDEPPGTPALPPDMRKISSVQNFSDSGHASNNGGDQTPKAESPVQNSLPWRPKVREKDIEQFLQNERQKFFGYKLPNDSETLFGLPPPIFQSVAAFRRNIYVSLGDLQVKGDEIYNKFPFSQVEYIEETSTEKLYRRMLPNMTEIIIALLKVILASLPSKAKSDDVNILADVLTPETDTYEMLSNSINLDMSAHGHGSSVLEDTVKVAIDINRHKELIIKSSSAILITLLKFFRLNHVYQFENFSQYLVLANCLPLVLKFLDQNICRYFQSKHELCPFNYPKYPLYYVRNGYESPVLNVDNVDEGVDTESPSYYLWRNVFSSINLLRVVNKLTKWKHARTMMLVVFKSAPVFKRCMRAKLGIFQLYVLKLLKMQARYLGRQWRKSNMDIISSIYLKVRHRLNDDWAFANETRSKSFDFQVEEGELGLAVKKFNSRRYHHILDQSGENATSNGGPFTGKSPIDDMDMRDFEPVDNSLQSVLSWQPNFSDRFKRNYSKWVDEEVIKAQIDWDALLVNSKGIAGDCY